MNGRKLPGTKGKTLGGSSTINFGNVIFPSRAGVEACGSFGNPGWNWDAYEPYITKFHTATGPSEEVREYLKGLQWTEGDYGSTGPVQISFGKDYLPYHAAWIETIKELGYELTEEPIKGVGTGPFINPGTIDPKTHTRSHSGVAYYPPSVQQRPNLRVVTHAFVERTNSPSFERRVRQ